MKDNTSRRTFLKNTIVLGGMAAIGTIPLKVQAMEKVSEDDPTAKAMGYVHDAADVDTAKFPKRAGEAGATQFCDNCVLYSAGGEEGWGTCGVFPGKTVAAKGWCNAWAAKG